MQACYGILKKKSTLLYLEQNISSYFKTIIIFPFHFRWCSPFWFLIFGAYLFPQWSRSLYLSFQLFWDNCVLRRDWESSGIHSTFPGHQFHAGHVLSCLTAATRGRCLLWSPAVVPLGEVVDPGLYLDPRQCLFPCWPLEALLHCDFLFIAKLDSDFPLTLIPKAYFWFNLGKSSFSYL
jgi:hypothetical protein